MSEILETQDGFLMYGTTYPKTLKGLQSMMQDEVLGHLDWACGEEDEAAEIIGMAFELGRVSAIESTEKPDFLSDEFLTKNIFRFNLLAVKTQNLHAAIAGLFDRNALSVLTVQHSDGGHT